MTQRLERVAAAIFEVCRPGWMWADLPDTAKVTYYTMAKAAVEAVLEAEEVQERTKQRTQADKTLAELADRPEEITPREIRLLFFDLYNKINDLRMMI